MPFAPTAEALTEAVEHAISIADALAGDWAVVLYDACYPAGRDPDRPTYVRPRPPADNPDAVPGERYDSGIGDQRGKDACAVAAERIVQGRRLADRAVTLLGGHPPAWTARRPVRTANEIRVHVYATTNRLRQALDHGVAQADGDTRALAHAAAVQLLEAHTAVRGVMRDFKQVREPTLEDRCWNCQRKVTRPKTGECEACSRYRRRAEEQIRRGKTPKHRYRPVPRYQDAYDARKRRESRLLPGELDIEGPVPRVRWVDGDWEPSTPHPDPEPRREAS